MRLRLPFIYQAFRPAVAQKRPGNGGFIQMVRNFPPSRSEWKKRSASEGTSQFPNGISGKLPYHLTSNRNFWIFWPNGKHARPNSKSLNGTTDLFTYHARSQYEIDKSTVLKFKRLATKKRPNPTESFGTEQIVSSEIAWTFLRAVRSSQVNTFISHFRSVVVVNLSFRLPISGKFSDWIVETAFQILKLKGKCLISRQFFTQLFGSASTSSLSPLFSLKKI